MIPFDQAQTPSYWFQHYGPWWSREDSTRSPSGLSYRVYFNSQGP